MYSIFEQLLQKYGVSTYKVSKETNIAQSVFSSWKTGISTPKQDKLQKIADYFGVSVDYLITGKEIKEIPEDSLLKKTEKEVERILESTKVQLTKEGLILDGKPFTDEQMKTIFDALAVGIEMAKKRG